MVGTGERLQGKAGIATEDVTTSWFRSQAVIGEERLLEGELTLSVWILLLL